MTARELLAILLMAACTYMTRVGGVFLPLQRVRSAYLQRLLAHLPVAVLAALIGPKLLQAPDASLWSAAVVTLIVVLASRSPLLGVLLGTGSCAAWRYFLS